MVICSHALISKILILSFSGTWYPHRSTVQPSTHCPLVLGRAKNKQTLLCIKAKAMTALYSVAQTDKAKVVGQPGCLTTFEYAESKYDLCQMLFFFCLIQVGYCETETPHISHRANTFSLLIALDNLKEASV